ncbi:hypothetical protein S886_14505 [Salmonella enterica subsp. arizonae]|uniref:Uncharacterized protein n=1 Tax=Salmonella enterica TaxID=28901 RepID=A0A5T7Y6M0_SALER|nr:hypothetical protein [Salmonella enterica]ECF6856543.1 hypothetical protein [Salmonella enterica subsp. arizonae]EDQ2391742.1 hypothetical protein [Salmonella enterica subsp. enterica]EDS7586664.1 hypothetical protein [Salmonella enterica subsp. diarizonae]EBN2887835.1 hypothetical protein [Salmonella enterica]
MSVKVFRSDIQPDSESAYQQWLNDNPDGFVVNALKSASGRNTKNDSRFTRIHRAKCKTINPLLSSTEKSGFTTERHQKLCATDFEVADSEARKITGLKFVKRCPNCI